MFRAYSSILRIGPKCLPVNNTVNEKHNENIINTTNNCVTITSTDNNKV